MVLKWYERIQYHCYHYTMIWAFPKYCAKWNGTQWQALQEKKSLFELQLKSLNMQCYALEEKRTGLEGGGDKTIRFFYMHYKHHKLVSFQTDDAETPWYPPKYCASHETCCPLYCQWYDLQLHVMMYTLIHFIQLCSASSCLCTVSGMIYM